MQSVLPTLRSSAVADPLRLCAPATQRISVMAEMNRRRQVARLMPLGALAALAGYLGPWADPRWPGWRSGLDLGEYRRLLPTVRSGAVSLWREAF